MNKYLKKMRLSVLNAKLFKSIIKTNSFVDASIKNLVESINFMSIILIL